MAIQNIFVVGAGLMGSGIAQTAITSGYNVVLNDQRQEALERAAAAGVIDGRVVALGGVSPDCIPQLRRWRFGGAAMLGGVWKMAGKNGFDDYISALRRALDD